MTKIPVGRTTGRRDIAILVFCTNGMMKIIRKSYLLVLIKIGNGN